MAQAYEALVHELYEELCYCDVCFNYTLFLGDSSVIEKGRYHRIRWLEFEGFTEDFPAAGNATLWGPGYEPLDTVAPFVYPAEDSTFRQEFKPLFRLKGGAQVKFYPYYYLYPIITFGFSGAFPKNKCITVNGRMLVEYIDPSDVPLGYHQGLPKIPERIRTITKKTIGRDGGRREVTTVGASKPEYIITEKKREKITLCQTCSSPTRVPVSSI